MQYLHRRALISCCRYAVLFQRKMPRTLAILLPLLQVKKVVSSVSWMMSGCQFWIFDMGEYLTKMLSAGVYAFLQCTIFAAMNHHRMLFEWTHSSSSIYAGRRHVSSWQTATHIELQQKKRAFSFSFSLVHLKEILQLFQLNLPTFDDFLWPSLIFRTKAWHDKAY